MTPNIYLILSLTTFTPDWVIGYATILIPFESIQQCSQAAKKYTIIHDSSNELGYKVFHNAACVSYQHDRRSE